jgi:hypothetical protein
MMTTIKDPMDVYDSKLGGTPTQQHRAVSILKEPEGTPYARWAKMGLNAVKLDKHLYEVRMEVASGNRELYDSELDWKKSIKRQMALALAEVLVDDISFTKTDLPEKDCEMIMGHMFVLPMKLIDEIVKTSNLGK